MGVLKQHPTAIAQKKKSREIHPESLLHIPLLRQAITDPQIQIVHRAVDKNWHYEKKVPISITGFNPVTSSIFVGAESCFARWMRDPYSSARWYNSRDNLVREALFVAHDYLHCWAYLAINELLPDLGFGTLPITKRNIEDFVFCHLLTEAAAVVGLDYWFLSQTDLNELCDIGTAQRGLTVPYRKELIGEYRRWNPAFEIEKPEFFSDLARFYCEGGRFLGAPIGGMENNPLTYEWLNHEISYSATQRRYTRMWFSNLARSAISYRDRSALSAPVRVDAPWKSKLMAELGQLLWDKVRNGETQTFDFSFDPEKTWRSPLSRPADFRFINLNEARPGEAHSAAKGPDGDTNFKHLFYQFVSQYEYATFDQELIKLFPFLVTQKDLSLVQHLFRGMRKIAPREAEPRDLFILN